MHSFLDFREERSKFTKAEESFDRTLLSCSHTLFTIGAGVRNGEPCTRRQRNEVEKGQSSHMPSRLAPSIGKLTRAVMDHKAGRVDRCQDGLPVDKHLNGWLLGTEEAKCDLVKAWSYSQDDALVLIPEEVLWAGVYILDLPRHSVAIVA